MIYKEKGVKTSKGKKVPNPTNLPPLEMLAKTPVYEVEEYQYTEEYKLTKAYYFISGEFTENNSGAYHRNNGGLLSRDLICIDIEDTKMDTTEVLNTIQESLKEYKYVLYSTFKHEESNPRLRLVLEPTREILENEYKPTIQHVMALVGVNYDDKCETWSQLSGLPIVKKGNKYIFIKHLDGLPYPVQEAVKEEKKVIATYSNEPIKQIPHDQAISIMEKYIYNEKNNLLERNNNYLSCLTVIAKSVVTGEIEYDTAIECMEMLALGNVEWKENNLKELNGEITRADGSIEYFKNNYTFISKFQKTQQGLQVTNAVTKKKMKISTNESGKVIQTLENLEKIILSITPVAYNELKEVIEITESNGKVKQLTKRHKELLRSAIEKRYKIKVNAIDIETALVGASERYRYHPIKSKILSTKWDGIPRAESFFIDVLGVEDNVYNRECTRKWLLAGVYRAFKPGTKFDEMLIIHGEQGLGKSTTFLKLSLGCHLETTEEIKEELMRKALRSWFVELSELSTIKKTNNDTVKAWLSTPVDCVKKLYDRDPQDYPRSFIVCGTTNDKEILKDRTGNRRYWLMYGELEKRTLDIKDVDEEYILQLWSEVYQWYLKKESLLISDETKLYMEKLSSGALEHNPLEERVNSILEMKVPNNWHDFIVNKDSRFKYYNYVNDYVSYGKSDINFPQQTQILDITTRELHFLLGNGTGYNSDLRGNLLAKDINKVMNNLPNWKKSESIKRSYSERGVKGFVKLK